MGDAEKTRVQQSWADQMDEDQDLPPDSERIEGNQKIVTHWDLDEDGNRVKFVRYYKIETIKVPKSVARRKSWKKFGKAAGDPPGPNPANTQVNDEIKMDFIREKENQVSSSVQDDALKNAKLGKGFVKCRFCEMDHWSTSCPYKDKLAPKDEAGASGLAAALKVGEDDKGGTKKYVVPGMRDGGANRKGEMMPGARSKDEANTIRVTNLPEDIQDSDIKELFASFGRISRIFLARDKHTGQSKGFAFVSFDKKEEAAKAVALVNGHGYANLILNVEWAKPSGNN